MVEALGISLHEIIFAIVNFLILVGVLTKFLYKPYLNMIDARQQSIKDSFAHAADTNRLADEKMDQYNKRIANAENEGREIIKNAKVKAEAQANDIIAEATKEAADIKLRAEKEVERQRAKAMSEMKSEIAAMAVLVAERVLEREMAQTGQAQYIDSVIEEVGAAKWQN